MRVHSMFKLPLSSLLYSHLLIVTLDLIHTNNPALDQPMLSSWFQQYLVGRSPHCLAVFDGGKKRISLFSFKLQFENLMCPRSDD